MTLLEDARDIIKRYLSERGHLSTSSLAKSAGIPVSTARSIIHGEVQSTSKDNLVPLLLECMSADDVRTLLERHGEYNRWVTMIEVCASKAPKKVESGEFQWKSTDHEIVALACLPAGIRRDRVLQLYGTEHGENRLEALLNAGILREVNGSIRQQSGFVRYPAHYSHQKAKHQAQNWSAEDAQKGGACYHLTTSCTLAKAEQGREYTREYLDKMANLGEDEPSENRIIMLSIFTNVLGGESK